MENIMNGTIKSIRWDRERGLTQWIAIEGDGWGCSLGGYHLGGSGCYDWMMQVMDVLDICEFEEKLLVGKNVRVRFSGNGGCGDSLEAIGNIVKEKWFCPKEFFADKQDKENSLPAKIEEAPTVDAVPVVHGLWKYDCEIREYCCTNCEKCWKNDETTPYCPICGAKMDGD